MKTSQVHKFAVGSQEIVIESFADGSAWSVRGMYGANRQGVITALYVNGKLQFSVIKTKLGYDSVMNKSTVAEFKKFVKEQFKTIDKEWHKLHNELYGV